MNGTVEPSSSSRMAAATWFSPTASSAASRVLNEGRAVGRLFWVVLEFTRRTLPNHPDRGVADTTVRR